MNAQRNRGVLTIVVMLSLSAAAASGQKQPLAYVLPAGDKTVIVLGDTPPLMAGFTVMRKGPGDADFGPLTDEPVRALDDPSLARQMMGSDFDWISQRVATVDPDAVWRRIRARHDLAVVLSLVSNGLRMALGRTWFDLAVTPGQMYTYRVLLLDSLNKELGRVEKQITISPARKPGPPGKVAARTGKREVTVTWDYPRYQGGDTDLAVGFYILRQEKGGAPVLLTPSPALRIEGKPQFVDRDPAEGVAYTYSAQAVDIIGATSDPVALDTTNRTSAEGLRPVSEIAAEALAKMRAALKVKPP